jgi:hypothetical protein
VAQSPLVTAAPTEKDLAHEQVEKLEPNQLFAVVRLLKVMIDPVARSIADAPVEDEEIFPQTASELEAAHESIARGEGTSHQEVLRQFGSKRR